ncbi:MAG: YveK family protein [Acidimicrobiia bacterium]
MRLILDRWRVIVALAVLGLIAGFGLSQLKPTVYQSTSEFVIAVDDSIEDPGDMAAALGVLRNRQITATFAELLQSQTLLDRAARQVGVATSDFESSSVVLPESNVLSLTISGPEAKVVREINELIGGNAVEDLVSLYPIYDAQLLESAKTPSAPASPTPTRDGLFAAAVGTFLGVVLVLVWPFSGRPASPLIGLEAMHERERAEAGRES